MKAARVVIMIAMILASLVSFAEAAQEQQQFFIISVQTANIRHWPTTDSVIVGKAKRGDTLRVVGEEENWVKVVYVSNGVSATGYVAKRLGNMMTVKRLGATSDVRNDVTKVADDLAELHAILTRDVVPETNTSRFGAGFYLAESPGGFVPSVLYDMSDRATLVGSLGLYSDVTSVMGQILYRFPQPSNQNSKVSFEPYVGGGLALINVSYGFRPWTVSENFAGMVGSGGTFVTVKSHPRWRFSGDLNLVKVNGSGVSVAGLGLRLGAHYLF